MGTTESGGVKALVVQLDDLLASTTETLRELEGHKFDQMHGQARSLFPLAFTRKLFATRLEDLSFLTALTLEAADLDASREEFLAHWQTYKGKLEETTWYPEVDALDSEPERYLELTVRALRHYAFGKESPTITYHRDLLERLLESTAALVHRRTPSPTRESDIQDVMRDYLSAAFADYVPQPKIPGHVKCFIPDGGVRRLGAAIEFKYVDSEQQLKTALSGILEDSAGCRGSKDWTTFYSVIYMTDPFEATPRFREDLRRVSADSWKVYLVNQGSGRSRRTSRGGPSSPGTRATGSSRKQGLRAWTKA